MSSSAVNNLTKFTAQNLPSAADFGIGIAYREDIKAIIESDGVNWFARGSSDSIADRPSAAAFGKGSWTVSGIYKFDSDGVNWKLPSSNTSLDRQYVTPKISVISEIANGKSHQGFPTAARYNGNDYVIYREGVGHLEATPITNTARMVVAVCDSKYSTVQSRTVIYNTNGIDPRGGCILRDDFGNAILVNGVFKVTLSQYATGYNPLTQLSCYVWDLDPANLAAGLTNPVLLPTSAAAAVQSDIRLLSTGVYAFIGWTAIHTCYLVTTTNWTTFTTEYIGKGNECAFCETPDGKLNVVARYEEHAIETSIFYKRDLAGGAWTVHSILPYTLNAPTFTKVANYSSTTPNSTSGWLLFARDKTGRVGLFTDSVPVCDLVCFISRTDYGRTIDDFTNRVVIAGLLKPNSIVTDGDAHYCAAISSGNGKVAIYTYTVFDHGEDTAGSSFAHPLIKINAVIDQNIGIKPEKMYSINYVKNPNFVQGKTGYEAPSANSTIITDSVTGNKILHLVDALSPSIQSWFECKAGETLFPKLRMRLNATNRTDFRHIKLNIYDNSSGTNVLVETVTPQLDPAIYSGEWRTVVFNPFVAPSTKLFLSINNEAVTSANTDISHIEISDNYTRELSIPERVDNVVVSAPVTITISSGSGTIKGSGTYSNAFWELFGMKKMASGIPFPAKTNTDVTVVLSNVLSGTDKVLSTKTVVNSDGTIAADFAMAPGEAVTIGASVTATATVYISTGTWPYTV
jgi:hypothetical protein